MDKLQQKQLTRTRRQNRVRSKIRGTADRPRLSVFRSNRALFAQIINDETGTTLAALSTSKVKAKTPRERAALVGTEIAKMAKEKGITKIVFDRGPYGYLGQIKAVADAAREAGLNF